MSAAGKQKADDKEDEKEVQVITPELRQMLDRKIWWAADDA